MFGMVLGSIKEQLGSGANIFNSGDIAQLGADFVIAAGRLYALCAVALGVSSPADVKLALRTDGQVTFTHRMRTTLDHTEVEDLLKHAGLEASSAPPAEKEPETAASVAAPAEPVAA